MNATDWTGVGWHACLELWAVIESDDASDAQENDDGLESFVGNFRLVVWHLASACARKVGGNS